MRIAVPTCCISEGDLALRPWNFFKDRLASHGIIILPYSNALDAFKEEHDAMLLDIWLDWDNKQHFIQEKILPVMDAYATYRATFPGTRQIIVNHTDMSRRPYATPYWRPGDPIFYRTPSYDRSELAPFPPKALGDAGFVTLRPPD